MNTIPREDVISSLLPAPPALSLQTQIDLWEWAVGHYRELILEGLKSSEAVERTARMLLQRAPSISKSFEACTRQLYRKINRIAQDGRVDDKRGAANKAKRAPALSDADVKAISTAILQCGDLDFAWRACLKDKTVSLEILSRYPESQGRRTRAPKVVRRAFPRAKVQRLLDLYFRPRRARQTGPFIPCVYNDVFAGDWRSTDDFTLELYFIGRDGTLRRGQLILDADVRSKRVLNFGLIDAEGYRQDEIKRVWFGTCKEFGLPRYGWHVENGVWRKGKMMAAGTITPLDEDRKNFADRLGLRITNALPASPRGKIIENIGKLLQRFIRRYQNWVGPDEKRIKFEHSQRALSDVRAKRTLPIDCGIPTFEDWGSELENVVIPAYNSTPQESRVMGGDKVVFMSPDEAWRECQPKDTAGNIIGTDYLSHELEWLFYHREVVTVGRNGIKLPYGGGAFYMGSETGKFRGEQVIAYVNADDLSSIWISDLRQERFAAVPRLEPLSRFNASGEDLVRAHEQIRTQDSNLRMLVRQIRSETTFKIPARTVLPDAGALAAVDIGRKLRTAQERDKTERSTAQTASRNSPLVSAKRDIASFLTQDLE